MADEGLDLRGSRSIRHCVYCGQTEGLQRDHVIPTSYLRERRRYEGDWLVPSCGECNRTLGAELIFNVPDRAYWLFQSFSRKYRRLLTSIPWCEEELDEVGPNLRSSIIIQERERRSMLRRLDHLKVVASQPITYMAPLRPFVDPYDEDVPDFIDDDIVPKRDDDRLDMLGRIKRKYRVKEME